MVPRVPFFVVALTLTPAAASGAIGDIVFREDFSADSTLGWQVNTDGSTDHLVDFHYDYAQIGVPAAPNGYDTTGLVMVANTYRNSFGGFSVSPVGQSFSGDYVVSFDLWSNYLGPLGAGGSGSTQLSTYGLGTNGVTPVWPAAPKESVSFAHSLDGGSQADFRAYSSLAPSGYPDGSPVYAAPSRNNTDPYYTNAFAGVVAPDEQLAIFSTQTGITDPGEVSFRWLEIELAKIGDRVTWSIDGVRLAEVDLTGLTLGGGNIFFGHSDVNASSSSSPFGALLNLTLVDNIRVTTIPEPAGAALALFGLAGLVRRRRR